MLPLASETPDMQPPTFETADMQLLCVGFIPTYCLPRDKLDSTSSGVQLEHHCQPEENWVLFMQLNFLESSQGLPAHPTKITQCHPLYLDPYTIYQAGNCPDTAAYFPDGTSSDLTSIGTFYSLIVEGSAQMHGTPTLASPGQLGS